MPCRIIQITMENSIQRQLLLLSSYFPLNIYLMLDPNTLVRSARQGIEPHNMAIKVRTLSIVRHPELIALYASAPNHVLGQ